MIENKRILILGGTGSLGNALVEKYLEKNLLFAFSRSENTQWLMKQKFSLEKNYVNLKFLIGDIKDKERVKTCIFETKPNIILICAAMKQIDTCEEFVSECVNTNIIGVRNVIDVIYEASQIGTVPHLETVIFISTDKACSPVSSYGMAKAISERLIIEKSQFVQSPKFVNVRYGNVLSSRGSIFPFYKNIVESKDEKRYFPVTDPKMTRFFMTLSQSTDLIEYAILNGKSGDTIIPKSINSYKILDIATAFSNKYNIPIKETGIRQGEKLHETLINYTESLRTIEKDNYYIIKPSYHRVTTSVNFSQNEYVSSNLVGDINELPI